MWYFGSNFHTNCNVLTRKEVSAMQSRSGIIAGTGRRGAGCIASARRVAGGLQAGSPRGGR